ncbi:hypothetical protein D9M72_585770 [compost metagenome]
MRRSPMTSVMLSTVGRIVCLRENASNCRTSTAARLALRLISIRSAKLASAGRADNNRWSEESRIAVSTLLKSCAMPPASVPTAFIFCVCAIWFSSAFCSVISSA